jgi:hybrid cluster-associated redox disulfide protein
MLDVLVALIACAALAIAVTTCLRQRSWREVVRDVQRRLYVTQARLNELENTVQRELQMLRALVRQHEGGLLFAPTMKIADAITIDPRVRDVLAQFHLGGCSSCAVNEEHTIEEAARGYGVELGRLMAALTALSNGRDAPLSTTQPGGLLQLTEF